MSNYSEEIFDPNLVKQMLAWGFLPEDRHIWLHLLRNAQGCVEIYKYNNDLEELKDISTEDLSFLTPELARKIAVTYTQCKNDTDAIDAALIETLADTPFPRAYDLDTAFRRSLHQLGAVSALAALNNEEQISL